MNYPDYETYEKLYARFLKRPSSELFEKIDLSNKTVLDLCCGNGRATMAALALGAKKVVAIDSEPHMVPEYIRKHPQIEYIYASAYNTLSRFGWEKFDVIVCQQAINYWFKDVPLDYILHRLNENGVFIFNTFNTCPPVFPKVKAYCLDDRNYCEISYRVKNKVYHIQAATDLPTHATEFDWIPPEEFLSKLSPFFSCATIVKGSTSIWQCTRLPKRT